MLIRNTADLLSHGTIAGRRVALAILEAALGAADPYLNAKALVRVEDGKLIVGRKGLAPTAPAHQPPPDGPLSDEPLVFDLDKVGRIFVVGGGKAAQAQAKALEEALGDLITDGQINAKKGDQVYLERIPVTLCGHPLPDEESVSGSLRILEIEQSAVKGDIVFLSESGGGTALMALPAPGISLADLQEVYRLLYFAGGAPMPVANSVRNLLGIVRGRHARHVGEATLIHIATTEEPMHVRPVTSQVPSGDPYERAIQVLKQYDCWDKVPESVRAFMRRADPAYLPLSPEEWRDHPRYYYRSTGPEMMLDAALAKARELGLNATVLASSLNDLPAQPIAEALATIALEAEALDRPLPAPCVLLCGGELVVATGEADGIGGRNQEFVLAAATRIKGSARIVIASADSDGADGPTHSAGGIVDGETLARARALGLDVAVALARHDSHTALEALGDTIETGILRTNVRDLRVMYVGAVEA